MNYKFVNIRLYINPFAAMELAWLEIRNLFRPFYMPDRDVVYTENY